MNTISYSCLLAFVRTWLSRTRRDVSDLYIQCEKLDERATRPSCLQAYHRNLQQMSDNFYSCRNNRNLDQYSSGDRMQCCICFEMLALPCERSESVGQ